MKNKPKKAMKKTIKRACAGMFAIMMAVSAMSIPSSAASVSGQVSRIDCGGSNSITATGASARTYAATSMTLNVDLYYCYDDITNDKIKYINNSNGNNPVSTIDVSVKKPSGNTRSNYCYSKHDAVYSLVGNVYHWGATTKNEYY